MRFRGSAALPLLLLLALLARIVVIVLTPDFRPIFDAADYDRHAISIADGHGYPPALLASGPSAFRPPLYPLALAVVHLVGGGWTAERLLGALFGVVSVLLIYLIVRRLWGRPTALLAAAIAAIFPPLVILNASLLSESPFIPLVLLTALAVLEYRSTKRLRWAIAAGALCGLAALTRTNGLLLVVAVVPGVFVTRPSRSRAALAAPIAVLVAAAVTVAPWVIRNTVVFHRFVGISTQSGYGVAGTYNPESRSTAKHPGQPRQTQQLSVFRGVFAKQGVDESARSSELTSSGLRYALHHPGYVAETSFWNTLRVFDFVHDDPYERELQYGGLEAVGVEPVVSPVVLVSLYLVIALALVGAVAEVRRRRSDRAPGVLWLFPVVLILPAIGVWGLARYRAPVDAFLVMLAAVALAALNERARSSRAARTSADRHEVERLVEPIRP